MNYDNMSNYDWQPSVHACVCESTFILLSFTILFSQHTKIRDAIEIQINFMKSD